MTRVATLAGNPELEAGIATALGSRPDAQLVLRCVDRVELLAAVRGQAVDVVICAGLPAWIDAETREEISKQSVRVIAVVDADHEIRRAESMGALVRPTDASIDDICRDWDSETASPQPVSRPPSANGRLIAVWGPKGAPGRTCLAIALAHEVRRTSDRTLLLIPIPMAETSSKCSGLSRSFRRSYGLRGWLQRKNWTWGRYLWSSAEQVEMVLWCSPGFHALNFGRTYQISDGVSFLRSSGAPSSSPSQMRAFVSSPRDRATRWLRVGIE